MIGDALVSASFVSYIGPFNSQFRKMLWSEQWILIPKREQFHKLKELTHCIFLQTLLIKLFGNNKDSQLIEYLLRMPQLLFLAIDTHSLLIHNFKDRNGSKVKKVVI
jgi:hypothetical protein